mgnify:CR=1 FL=1
MNFSEYVSILEIIEDLKSEATSCAVIVEGKRDEEGLKAIGVEAEFFRVKGEIGTTILEICERVRENYKCAIIFVDIDRAGKAVAKKLRHYLSQMGVVTVERYRLNLLSKLETEQVENVPVRIRRLTEIFYRLD